MTQKSQQMIILKQALQLVNYRDIILNDDENSVKLTRTDQHIDGGAIVKGFASDKVKNIFIKNGIESAIIDLGDSKICFKTF